MFEIMLPPAPDALLQASRRLLTPLVRLLIRGGVTFPLLTALLRQIYVEVAAGELVDPRARTDSRLSLMTGVHRKEFRRLRLEQPPESGVPQVVTIGSQIVARWLGSPPYAVKGRPAALPRVSSSPDEPSFENLVTAVTTDIRPRVVLDDWLKQGIVSVKADKVRLEVPAFVPRGGAEQLFFFARNLHDHLAAAATNILSADAAPFLDRSVHYDRLSGDDADRLAARARKVGEAILRDLNREALALVDPEPARAGPDRPTRRVNFGVYIFAEDDAEDTPTR